MVYLTTRVVAGNGKYRKLQHLLETFLWCCTTAELNNMKVF